MQSKDNVIFCGGICFRQAQMVLKSLYAWEFGKYLRANSMDSGQIKKF